MELCLALVVIRKFVKSSKHNLKQGAGKKLSIRFDRFKTEVNRLKGVTFDLGQSISRSISWSGDLRTLRERKEVPRTCGGLVEAA